MPDHPQGHLVGDHVALFGYFFVVADFNKIGFGGTWQGEAPVGEEVTCDMDVVLTVLDQTVMLEIVCP